MAHSKWSSDKRRPKHDPKVRQNYFPQADSLPSEVRSQDYFPEAPKGWTYGTPGYKHKNTNKF